MLKVKPEAQLCFGLVLDVNAVNSSTSSPGEIASLEREREGVGNSMNSALNLLQWKTSVCSV